MQVREHHRKKRRDERRASAERKRLGLKKRPSKEEKIMGDVPAEWPFKAELLKETEAHAELMKMQKEKRKEERRREREREDEQEEEEEEMQGDDEDEHNEFRDVMERAARGHMGGEGFAADGGDTAAAGSGARMRGEGSLRAFYKEFSKVVESSDVVIEVLDARDPLGCRCLEVERFVRKSGAEKRLVLLLNKIDLVPKQVVQRWLKYLRAELPTVAFKSSVAGDAASYGDSLGAETLLSLLKNYARNKNIKTAVTVGIVGLPNVGKSSLINSLKRTRAVNVGGTPGVTRAAQEVSLDKHVKLLDSPGVVFKGADAMGSGGEHGVAATLRNAVKVEKLADPVAVVAEIVQKCDAVHLQRVYRVQQFQYGPTRVGQNQQQQKPLSTSDQADRFLHLVATSTGMLRRGGVPDTVAAARMVLNDWNNGKIPYYTEPPERKEHLSDDVAVVTQWGSEFNMNDVLKNEKSLVLDALEEKRTAPHQKLQPGRMAEAPMLEAVAASAHEENNAPDLVPLEMDEEDAQQQQQQQQQVEEEEEAGAVDVERTDMRSTRSEKRGELKMRDEPSTLKKRAAAAASQVSLYASDGQFNPHRAREDKKRRKKDKKRRTGDDMDTSGGGADTSGGASAEAYDWSMWDSENRFAKAGAALDE